MRKALENGAEALLTKAIDFGSFRNEIDMRVSCRMITRAFAYRRRPRAIWVALLQRERLLLAQPHSGFPAIQKPSSLHLGSSFGPKGGYHVEPNL